jgi:hypothetical protein
MVANKENSPKLPLIFASGGMRRRGGETAARCCDEDVRFASIDAAQHHL